MKKWIYKGDPTDVKRLLFISHKVGKRGNCPIARRILFIRLMAMTELFALNKEEKHLVNEKTYQVLMKGHYPYALDVVNAVRRGRAIKKMVGIFQEQKIFSKGEIQ